MNTQIKEKWTGALRSGEYNQGKGSLKTMDKFCCLGVLCDLYLKEKGGNWREGYMIGDEFNFLPGEVMEWAELNTPDPLVKYGEKTRSLAILNDTALSFDGIADLIDENL